ncbi:asparagine synthase (glutamine-hydrolyzing) [Synechococcus sp. RSCCF101]|uniref:asparagine synthase (glutamine-hydrolyzing) n=1 Tax=Synechococcus sp. RSCCF101 TaxID=2511069 RepID=UPI00124450C9|nr:asparagine synthase (glutamine-hydrolyzing) [Synechococcus sp. RSCCF101]QEY31894.1 asparagine synthase (glutamine-hydrolyzing) [Synechococcus sp. RSCCF101]
MCGIGGILHRHADRAVDPQLLVNMAAIQVHRGPDGFGIATPEGLGVGFCHARLSIIDLNEQRARQPFRSEDGRVLMAHNGEFYDFQRIRADLIARGVRFTSKSDSEILLRLYQQQGLAASLPLLRGEFAFALYDRDEDSLTLVRDRFGIKPQYWCETEEGIVFGSELKVMFAHPSVQRRFSPEGLYHQLMQTMVPGTTAFEGIHQVKPGHLVRIRRLEGGRLQIEEERYWDVGFPRLGERRTDLDEDAHIDAVRRALLEAVEVRMVADVPVGCYLSGGIDSCSILGLAGAISQSPVKAFTIGFDDARYDETPIAREMADSCGADQDVITLSAEELYGHLETTLWHTERTIYNTLAVAKYLMSHRVNEVDYKVVMTGEGSDELFGGYPAFRRDMFLHGLDDLPPAERAEWQELLQRSNALVKGAMLAADAVEDPALDAVVGFTPSCLQPWLACAPLVLPLLHPELREQLRDYSPGQAIAATLDRDQLEGRHALDKAQYVWIKTMLEGQILTWGGDRVDMANSMEARPAFLDHHLAEVAVQVPPELRIKGRTEKYVLREAMKGLLPEVLYKREKFAFMAPPAHTDASKWRRMLDLADEHLSEEAIESAGLLSSEGVRQLFARHENPDTSDADRVQMDAVINHLLGVQILHKLFIARDVPALARREADRLGWTVAATAA